MKILTITLLFLLLSYILEVIENMKLKKVIENWEEQQEKYAKDYHIDQCLKCEMGVLND